MPRMIDIEEIEQLKTRLDYINSIPFADIVWLKDGKHLPISKDEVNEWTYLGLSNTEWPDFAGISND